MNKLIIGLGNIGDRYVSTRHNSGFLMLDALAIKNNAQWQQKAKFKANVTEFTDDDQKIILAKPTTYYNLSGEAARAICDFYKIQIQDILAIHDELDLPFGTIRTRIGGSDAGNNGIKNLTAHLGQNFARVRVGIANDYSTLRPADQFVLDNFTSEEQKQLPTITQHVLHFIDDFVSQDKNFVHDSVKI